MDILMMLILPIHGLCFASDILDKSLISKIYKEHDSTPGIQTTQLKKWAKDLNKHFSKEDIQRDRDRSMLLACSALAPLSNELSCETGSFSHCHKPHSFLQLEVLSLSFPVQPALPCSHGLLPWYVSCPLCCLSPVSTPPTILSEYFFNS